MKESNVYGVLQVYSVTISYRHYFELVKRTSLINKGFCPLKFPKNPYFFLFRAEVGLGMPYEEIAKSLNASRTTVITRSVSDEAISLRLLRYARSRLRNPKIADIRFTLFFNFSGGFSTGSCVIQISRSNLSFFSFP